MKRKSSDGRLMLIAAAVALFTAWVGGSCVGELSDAYTTQTVITRFGKVLSPEKDAIAFWFTITKLTIAAFGGIAGTIASVWFAMYNIWRGDKFGTLEGRTGQRAAPLIDDTKRSNR